MSNMSRLREASKKRAYVRRAYFLTVDAANVFTSMLEDRGFHNTRWHATYCRDYAGNIVGVMVSFGP